MRNLLTLIACAVTLVLLAGIAALEWYAHVAAPRPAQPVAAVTAAPSAAPAGGPVVYVPKTPPPSTPTPAPAATAAAPSAAPATATPEPMQTLAPGATLPPVQATRAANAPPQILGMSLSASVVHPGQVVSGSVETSTNVASVEARIAGYSASLSKVGAGRFALTYRVPNVPFFLRRTYTIQVIARNARGDAVSSSLPVTVQ